MTGLEVPTSRRSLDMHLHDEPLRGSECLLAQAWEAVAPSGVQLTVLRVGRQEQPSQLLQLPRSRQTLLQEKPR